MTAREQAVRRRRDRVRDAMAAAGLSSLLVYFNGQHFMLRMNPLMWLTDYKPIGPAALILTAAGDARLLVSPPWDLTRAREQALGASIEASARERFVAECGRMARGLEQPIGIVGRDTMAVGLSREFSAAFGETALVDTPDLIKSLAETRDALELERITKAAEIADAGFARLCEAAEVGMREYELAAEVEAAMQSAGSDDNYGLMAAGAHNQAIRAPTDRRLETGDLIVGEITPCYRGSFAQLCRTLCLGEPTSLQKEKYQLLILAQDAGMRAAKPGRPSSDIAEAVNAVIGAAGYADYCRQPYMRTRGHGLGFGGVVPYDVTESAGPALAENMTMIIHPNQYIPETGYMMLGDTVVIERNGPRSFTQTARRIFSKAVAA